MYYTSISKKSKTQKNPFDVSKVHNYIIYINIKYALIIILIITATLIHDLITSSPSIVSSALSL